MAQLSHPNVVAVHDVGVIDDPPAPALDARRSGADADHHSWHPLTWMGAVDWAVPRTIPPILAPSVLRAGAGTMILNVLATRARDAGVHRLRYAGPYPTAALWRSLQRSFPWVTW